MGFYIVVINNKYPFAVEAKNEKDAMDKVRFFYTWKRRHSPIDNTTVAKILKNKIMVIARIEQHDLTHTYQAALTPGEE